MPNDRLCRWAGWGRSQDAISLDDRPTLKAYLSERLGGLHDPPLEPPSIDTLSAPESRLDEEVRSALLQHLKPDQFCTETRDRLIHSVGHSYRDMLRVWAGKIDPVTDAVIYPHTESEVAAVLEAAARFGVAVVPFGGGTSVVGGVEPRKGPHRAVITLDTLHLNHVTVDTESHLADIGAGAFGPEIENGLRAAGFTLGHFPQSFEFSTLGGWIAPRGAGQQSTRYGKIEEIIQAVRLVTPSGVIETRNVPAAASGPSIVQHIVGSEGTVGVITSATARIHRLPEETRYLGFILPTFESGCELFRQLAQADLPLSVARLSDAEETRWMAKASAEMPSLASRVAKAFIKSSMRRRRFDFSQVCAAIVSLEGDTRTVRLAASRVRAIARRCNAVHIGSTPGKRWEKERFRLPYLRDELLPRRVMVDTLETAANWSNLHTLYNAVTEAIDQAMRRAGPPGVVMCHLSHLYQTGSSLYFTFLARQCPDRELAQWQEVKDAATAAILANHGTLSHHHGIGYEHRPLSAEHGGPAVAALAGANAALDPTGIMNPGKMFDG